MKHKILIIGAGEMGKALSSVLKQKKGVEIKFWDKNPRLSSSKDIDELVKGAQYIFLCVPSPAIMQVTYDIKPYLKRDVLVVSLTKGIEKETNKFSSEILRKRFGKNRIAIMAGPMLAEEINKGLSTKVTTGSTKNNFEKLEALLNGTNLHVEHSPDIKGVSIAGVLKNIYALGLGIIDGLGLGSNAKGVFMNVAVLEMEAILKRLGGKSDTALMLAGIGDLEATGNSPFSTNFIVGQKIASGGRGKLISEGSVSIEPLSKRLGNKDLPPALSAIRKSIKNPKKAREIFIALVKNA
ncbi:NAD(P)-binding domain-containing protein [Patescibacteria group bacterium]|nr:NAD(P)-binding domain-containing protein [Patescibacteria group bacterium]